MSTTQRVVTGFMAVLMLAAIMLMPAQIPAGAVASEFRSVGKLAAAPVTSPETPQDEVRDLTY